MSDTPAPAVPEAPTISGRVVVIAFLLFVIVGVITAVELAKWMRPATMAAHQKTMPLSGTLQLRCYAPDRSTPTDVRHDGLCPQSGQIAVSLPDPGIGIKTITYVLVGGQGTPPMGQFTPKEEARLVLNGTGIGTRVAAFIYADGPLSTADLAQALRSAPPDIPSQLKVVELFAGHLMHGDPNHPRELRTARVELKITG